MSAEGSASEELPSPIEELSTDVTAEDRELIRVAMRSIGAVSDDEHGIHTAASAVRTSDGLVFQGGDLVHSTGGAPAELMAIANARASGARRLTKIVTVAFDGQGPLPPCGKVRQVLLDYFPTIRVIMPVDRALKAVRILDLLPLGVQWNLENRFVERFDSYLPADYEWSDDE